MEPTPRVTALAAALAGAPILVGARIAAEAGLAALAVVPVALAGWRLGRGSALVLFGLLVATYLLAGVVLPRAEARLAAGRGSRKV